MSEPKKSIYIETDGTPHGTLIKIGNETINYVTNISFNMELDGTNSVTLTVKKAQLNLLSDKIPVNLKALDKKPKIFATAEQHTTIDDPANDPLPEKSKLEQATKLYCKIFEEIHKKKTFPTWHHKMAFKPIVEKYSMKEFDEMFRIYVQLNDTYLKTNGYPLSLFMSSMNKVIMKMNKTAPDDGIKIFKEDKYGKELSLEQIRQYMVGKNENMWQGTEDWAKQYETEIIRRKILLVDISSEDYEKIKKEIS